MKKVTIKEAKRMMMECMDTYLQKDESGYCIPQNKQRPIYMEGPAGIGKTELAAQLAKEKGIGFVSYSMTHHTRQSAVGLPAIVEHSCADDIYKATEYTMSEIVDSVYQAIEQGEKEGILFIDEVNCVSETLSAVMLQFLQNKSFGPHRIPEGWIIITAGNPPEYNKSVKSFDSVTCDRLRIIHLEPDVESWIEYAAAEGVHPVVIEYVSNNRQEFYSYKKSREGVEIVTARGWEDLSNAIKANESFGYEIDDALVGQFIQKESVVLSFMSYYSVYRELLKGEEFAEIFAGRNIEQHAEKMSKCAFEEKWAILMILLMKIQTDAARLVRLWKKKTEAYCAMEEKLSQWNEELTNTLIFVKEAFGCREEMEHYQSMMYRNKDTGYLLALRKNEMFQKLYQEMKYQSDTKKTIRKEIRERRSV